MPAPAKSPAAWLLIGVLLSGSVAFAAPTNSTWLVRDWESDDGLPNNNVTGLAQTDDGYLWVANPGRLARFDGATFEMFSSLSLAGLDQKVTSVAKSREGGLWLGMEHGALVYLHSVDTRVYTNGLPNLIAWTLTEDAEGAVWIIYGGSTVYRFKDGKGARISEQNGLPTPTRLGCSLACDCQGRLWFATGGTIAQFKDGRFEEIPLPESAGLAVRLAGAHGGGVWVCAGSQVFRCERDGHVHSVGAFQPEQPGSEPTVLLEDHQGAIWIGTSSSGLFRYGRSGFESIPISHGRVASIMEDRDGYIWVGTGGGGLLRVEPRAIKVENVERGFLAQAVQSICGDASRVLWATTENGLVIVRSNDKWTPVWPGTEWSGARATCVAADACGTVWIGTRRRQLIRYRDGRFTSLPMPSQIIHALLVETNGDVWIGGEVPENLLRLHDGKLQTKTLPPGIRIIRGMAEDATGNLWLGTSKGMLLRVNGDQVTDETARTTGTPLSIRGLHTTSDGSLWIAYVGGGVGWLKGERYLRIDMAKGLYDDIVSQIVGDDQGCLWFGCDHGIFKVARQEFDELAAGRIERVRSIHYGRDHGLPSLQANFGDAPGAIRSQDGRLWLPMRTGVAMVEPQRLRQDLRPPTVLLKRIVVDDQTIASYGGVVPVSEVMDLQHVRKRLRLVPGHHRLQFDFAALSPGAAENVCFRYRMDGIDERWIESDSQRSATYSRLAAENYQFHVTACNANGIWNSNDATFAFTVAPYFWQSWWFRLASLTLFTSGAVGIARYVSFRRLRLRLRELEQKAALERERARIAKDIHDDVGGSLTQTVLLLNLSQKNQTDPRKVNDYFGQISSGIRRVVESLDEIVWAVNPGNDQLPHVVDYMAQFAADFLRAANIRFHLDFPDNPPNHPLAPEVRHNLFLVLKEALNNVVRHAAASEVQVSLKATDDALNLIVKDNGRGFNGEWKSVGADGLRNMRQRMNDIGGNCAVESRPGSGTRVAAFLPWSASKRIVASPNHATNRPPQ